MSVSTLVDALFTLQASLGKRQLGPNSTLAADVNGDGRITLVDALFILQASLGKRELGAKPVVVAAAGDGQPVACCKAGLEKRAKSRLSWCWQCPSWCPAPWDVQLRFDPELLKWAGFEAAESVDPALIEVHAEQPGRLRLVRLGTTAGDAAELGRLLFQRHRLERSAMVELEAFNVFDLSGFEQETDATRFRRYLPGLPTAFKLYANVPNPFNPETVIRYDLAGKEAMDVRLAIYNVAGQLVRNLVDEQQRLGTYEVVWDGLDESGAVVSTGVYLYRLEVGDQVRVRRMTLLQ